MDSNLQLPLHKFEHIKISPHPYLSRMSFRPNKGEGYQPHLSDTSPDKPTMPALRNTSLIVPRELILYQIAKPPWKRSWATEKLIVYVWHILNPSHTQESNLQELSPQQLIHCQYLLPNSHQYKESYFWGIWSTQYLFISLSMFVNKINKKVPRMAQTM